MPTIEERLAALETKLAALTETTPTTYYEHQYSGEEIDAAVGRALTGGALDTSVTNVSNQLGTFVRPNLLDNWYFGRPVDQRKGKIIQLGVNIYTDSTLKTLIGPAAYACPVVELTSTYAKVQDAKNTGSYYYAAPGDVVRGYTGNGYSVDRWYFDTDSGSCSLTLTSEGLKFIATASATGITSLKQDIDPTMLSTFAGKTVTLSLLGKTDISQQVLFYVNSKVAAVNYATAVNGVCMTTLTYTFPDVLTGAAIFVYGRSYSGAGEGTILAAKLELGPAQTLAHKEGERWVLNEIPKYSRELLDCRTYFVKFGYADKYCILGSGVARDDTFVSITVPIPAELRTYPVVILTGVIIIRHSDRVNQSCTTVAWDANGVSSILLKIKASGLTPGDAYEAFLAPGNYLDVSCDL